MHAKLGLFLLKTTGSSPLTSGSSRSPQKIRVLPSNAALQVKGAILVELQHAPLQQALAAEALLKKVAPHAFFHVLYSR